MPNFLAHEASPYLRQHAQNPVDWFPWGADAFEKARREEKPIFLSIGYSTCHWCHVMAHESFENADVATVLNEYFISIKVDREERPDVDRLYLAFVQASTGSGGWPMSVWLTPDAKPFFGGTYFPPEDRHGRPGFVTVLERVTELWATQRGQLLAQGEQVIEALRASTSSEAVMPGNEAVTRGAVAFLRSFDPQHGGFGGAPKFPRPSVLNFLFRHAHAAGLQPGEGIMHAALETLRKMAAGGMHDQIGGGFHRYSVDELWHVPHFEKMLYDQAQLASSFVDAWLITKDPVFSATARDTLDYVLRALRHPDGGFFSAEDADSLISHESPEHAEGAFYVWTLEEIKSALPPELAALAIRHWGIESGGNAPAGTDPHGQLTGKNVLIQRTSPTEPELAEAKRLLFAIREKRSRPHLDDKVLTGWNGLMISAFARAGAALSEPRYTRSAQEASAFVSRELLDHKSGNLFRAWRDGKRSAIPGFAEDYAFLIQGLIDLYEADFDCAHLRLAVRLQERQDEVFWDTDGGGYFTGAADDPLVPVRTREDYDGAEPSASSVSAMNLLRLGRMLHREAFEERAIGILKAFGDLAEKMPTAVPQMLAALQFRGSPERQLVIAGLPGANDTRELLAAARSVYAPDVVLLLADGGEGQSFLAEFAEAIAAMHPVDGKAAAYFCENFACQHPVTETALVTKLLRP